MRKTRSIVAALLLTMAPITFSPAVGAQATPEDPTTSMARSRFKEGVEFYDKGEYEQARASFLQAYALKKHPSVLINLAWSCLRSAHPLEADRYFKQFLTEGKDITDKQRADANDGLTQAHAKVGRIEVMAGAGTEVTIDGERIGTVPLGEPLAVEAGAHTVKFKGSDGSIDIQSITVLGGEKAIARFKSTSVAPGAIVPLPPPPPTPPPEAAPPQPAPPPPSPTAAPGDMTRQAGSPVAAEPASIEPAAKGAFAAPRNMAPVIILGVVAVASYTAAVTALVVKQQAQDKADQVVSDLKRRGASCPSSSTVYANACDAYATDTSNVNDDATAGNIALGIGIAATAGAFAYWLFADKGGDAHSATRPAVAPMVGANVGGLSVSGSF